MRILTTGNPNYGLAGAINEIVGGDFASRSNGFELTSDEGRSRLVEQSLDYDVFINCAALWKFHQTLLLEAVFNRWKDAGKRGRIINIGSTADTGVRGSSWRYPIEKKALRDMSRNLSYTSIGGNGIAVTYVSYGYLATPSVETKHPDKRKIDPIYAAGIIQWVIDQPLHLNVNEISLDPVQHFH